MRAADVTASFDKLRMLRLESRELMFLRTHRARSAPCARVRPRRWAALARRTRRECAGCIGDGMDSLWGWSTGQARCREWIRGVDARASSIPNAESSAVARWCTDVSDCEKLRPR